MFKALGRIRRDKKIFDVEVRPLNVRIYTNQPFNFKLQVQRGKQDAEETKQAKVDRSVKNSDIKQIEFSESFKFPCTFFIKDGVPDEKTLTFSVLKLFPGGEEVVIARQEVNLARHFGDDFKEATTEMQLTKKAQGSNVKSLTYSARITAQDDKDKEMLDECVKWRKMDNEKEEHTAATERLLSGSMSASMVASVNTAKDNP